MTTPTNRLILIDYVSAARSALYKITYAAQRKAQYPELGEQMDVVLCALATGDNTAATALWAQITAIKTAIPATPGITADANAVTPQLNTLASVAASITAMHESVLALLSSATAIVYTPALIAAAGNNTPLSTALTAAGISL